MQFRSLWLKLMRNLKFRDINDFSRMAEKFKIMSKTEEN